MANEESPVTFYATPPVGISAWHRQWVKGQIAGEASVSCEGCAAPCCTSFEYVTLDPHVDDLSMYATKTLTSGAVVLQQHADGSCLYFVDGRCSIYNQRPCICRLFDCRMYNLLPRNEGMDALGWSGPARVCAERLRDTADARFRLIEKEPGDRTFDMRFLVVFVEMLERYANELDMSSILEMTLMAMTDERTQRRYIEARERAEASRGR
jgi:Fe-S-cluster containining protein